MKPKKNKPSAIAQAIEDSVFANINQGQVSDDDNEDTRAKVVENDDENDDSDYDVFTKDYSNSKPSRLRVLNAAGLENDERYKGKKVSRKQLQDDEDLENDSEDSEDEMMNAEEHKKAELGHMFEVEGVNYNDEDDPVFNKSKKKRMKDFQKYDNDIYDMKDHFESEEEDYDEEVLENEQNEKDDENGLTESDGDDESKNEESEDNENSGDDDQENDSDDDDDEDDDDEDDEMDEEDMGPDLSAAFEKAAQIDNDFVEDDNDDEPKFMSNDNVDKEVAKGRAIKRQLQIWDGLLELRITLQKSLTKINQLPQCEDMKTFKEALENSEDTKLCQFNMAKILDQLIQLRSILLSKNKVFETQNSAEASPAKKRKLNDYEKVLQTNFSSMKSWRNDTIENWNDRTRIASNDKSFSGFDTSVVRQIEHILSDKPRLTKRTQLRRTAYDILGQENDQEDHNEEIFGMLTHTVWKNLKFGS